MIIPYFTYLDTNQEEYISVFLMDMVERIGYLDFINKKVVFHIELTNGIHKINKLNLVIIGC